MFKKLCDCEIVHAWIYGRAWEFDYLCPCIPDKSHHAALIDGTDD